MRPSILWRSHFCLSLQSDIKILIMRKAFLIIILTAIAVSSYGQTRAMGVRNGVSGFEADYQHEFVKDRFLECNFGMDFGCLGKGYATAKDKLGIKATAVYNFIWARPAWTNEGKWALYEGPGLTSGYVHDDVHYTANDGVNIIYFQNHGFMLGVCAQVGIEYTFWFPLQLSVDLRPTVAMHINNRLPYTNPENPEVRSYHKARIGFYDNGLLGFVPSVSVRYRF